MIEWQLSQVRRQYPNLPQRALDFFHYEKAPKSSQGLQAKSGWDFALDVGIPTGEGDGKSLPPDHIVNTSWKNWRLLEC